MQLTKQGVRDLNGPRMNGAGYNGRRTIACPHFKNPHFPTRRESELRANAAGDVVMTSVYRCTNCGEERFGLEDL